jgi:hypothetical protein
MDTYPALPVAVDLDTSRVRIDPRFGTRHAEYEMVYTEYDAGRIQQGYCCIECGEAQIKDGLPKAFPEACSACGFPMRQEQAARYSREFEGYTTVGPSRGVAELRAEDEEVKERARRTQEGRPTSSILVPGWAK